MKLSLKEIHAIETEMLREVAAICERHGILYFLAYGSLIGAVRHKGPIPWDPDVDILVPHHHFEQFIKLVRAELSEKFFLDYFDVNPEYPALMPRIALKGYSSYTLHLDVFRLVGVPANTEERETYRKKARHYRNIFLYKKSNARYFVNYSWKRKYYRMLMKMVYAPISISSLIKKYNSHCGKYAYDDSEMVLNINGGYEKKEFIQRSFFGNGILMHYLDFQVRVPENYHEFLEHFYGDYMQFPPKEQQVTLEEYEIREL